jgi:hypothetical protein
MLVCAVVVFYCAVLRRVLAIRPRQTVVDSPSHLQQAQEETASSWLTTRLSSLVSHQTSAAVEMDGIGHRYALMGEESREIA